MTRLVFAVLKWRFAVCWLVGQLRSLLISQSGIQLVCWFVRQSVIRSTLLFYGKSIEAISFRKKKKLMYFNFRLPT